VSRVICLGIACLAITTAGCEKRSDRYQNEAQTCSNLRMWAATIESLRDAGIRFEDKKTANEAVACLKETKIFSEYELSCHEADGWGRPFHWKVVERDGASVIKIYSNGKNGVDDDGGGDDLFAEVTVPKDGPIATVQNTFKHSWFD
jgi:hypothetical protein